MKKKIIIITGSIIAVLLIVTMVQGCKEALPNQSIQDIKPSISLDIDFEISEGQEVVLEDTNLTLSYAETLEDSRCPTDLLCFRQGNFKMKILLDQEEFELSSGDQQEPTTATYLDYHVTLLKVAYPEKMNDPVDENHLTRVSLIISLEDNMP